MSSGLGSVLNAETPGHGLQPLSANLTHFPDLDLDVDFDVDLDALLRRKR